MCKTRLENNWRYKTLQNLEKEDWGEPTYSSHLVTRCHELRNVPLNEFTVEDLRIMTGQQIGLNYLIPLALEKLKENILVEGDLYPGDLLTAVTKVNANFWTNHKTLYSELKQIIDTNQDLIDSERLKLGESFFNI